MLKWHSVEMWNVEFICSRHESGMVNVSMGVKSEGGSVWYQKLKHGENMGEKFEKNYCNSRLPFRFGSTRRRKVKRSMCNSMTQHRKPSENPTKNIRNSFTLSRQHNPTISCSALEHVLGSHKICGGSTISNLNNRVYITFTNYRRKSRSLKRIMFGERGEIFMHKIEKFEKFTFLFNWIKARELWVELQLRAIPAARSFPVQFSLFLHSAPRRRCFVIIVVSICWMHIRDCCGISHRRNHRQ